MVYWSVPGARNGVFERSGRHKRCIVASRALERVHCSVVRSLQNLVPRTRSTTLQLLDLRANGLRGVSVAALGAALRSNTSVRTLDLGQNPDLDHGTARGG